LPSWLSHIGNGHFKSDGSNPLILPKVTIYRIVTSAPQNGPARATLRQLNDVLREWFPWLLSSPLWKILMRQRTAR
jgi:hypothetical protein